jgi:hypothetical protein
MYGVQLVAQPPSRHMSYLPRAGPRKCAQLHQLMCPCLTNGYIYSPQFQTPRSKANSACRQFGSLEGFFFERKYSIIAGQMCGSVRSGHQSYLFIYATARQLRLVQFLFFAARPRHAAHRLLPRFHRPLSCVVRDEDQPNKGTHVVRPTYSLTCFLTNTWRQITGRVRTYSVPTRRRRSLCLKAQRT